MLISLNWINDYVDLKDIPLQEKINRFLLSTAEIEKVVEKGKDVQNIIFARVDKVENHPNSQKLHVLQVWTGTEHLQIVCGAPNVRQGMITALAQVGSVVGGHKIGKAKLAGVESFGMCCSEAELGIGSDDNGIMDITQPVTVGQDIKQVFEIDDVVFEIDNKSLTNRPDLWGHYGIAREFAAIFNRPLKKPNVVDFAQFDNLAPLSIKIEDNNCYRYSGITVENITQNKSPQNIKIRLNYVGQRDINLLADLTNYIMLDLGQPMHAFDNNVVKGIIVRPAKQKEIMTTLEDQQHEVPQNSMLICDSNNTPVAIAGVKGGKLSGITEQTNSLLLESACFDPTSIRKTSFAVGLRTDSSLRYEKSLDPNLTTVAIGRYLYLLNQIDPNARVSSRLTDVKTFEYPKTVIKMDIDFILKRTGVKNLTADKVCQILKSLEFDIQENNGNFEIVVPSHRATKDVSIKEDLIEEIARMYGYDNIVPQTVFSKVTPVSQNNPTNLEYKTKFMLASKYGFSEVHSHLWNFAEFNKEYGIESPVHVWLLDSSNSGNSGIRSALLPTLIKFFVENKNSFDQIKMFEIGRVASQLDSNNQVVEARRLGMLLASQTQSKEQLYFEIKNILSDIAQTYFGTKVDFEICQEKPTYFHPINTASVLHTNTQLGTFGLVHPALGAKLDKRFNIAFAEIDFDAFMALPQQTAKYKPVSKFQDVDLDFNFKILNNLTYAQVEKIISEFKAKLNFTFQLKDRYSQADFDNFEYWTFAFNLSHPERTLTGEDIDKFSDRLIAHMAQHNITLRA